ncbi:Hypothetical predicted protein [Cloeon dipterum]|uniref:Uncharacterized protein n=2 Tax=Cloeon dipterum TaxID=197152 RepID=A0A8S1DGM0_9INSE|nr:Hypothetical predicted protein [Cloeon dipterum]
MAAKSPADYGKILKKARKVEGLIGLWEDKAQGQTSQPHQQQGSELSSNDDAVAAPNQDEEPNTDLLSEEVGEPKMGENTESEAQGQSGLTPQASTSHSTLISSPPAPEEQNLGHLEEEQYFDSRSSELSAYDNALATQNQENEPNIDLSEEEQEQKMAGNGTPAIQSQIRDSTCDAGASSTLSLPRPDEAQNLVRPVEAVIPIDIQVIPVQALWNADDAAQEPNPDANKGQTIFLAIIFVIIFSFLGMMFRKEIDLLWRKFS